MTLPGTIVTARDQAPPRTPPTDTGSWYVVGLAEKGPVDQAVLIESFQAFQRTFGSRQSYAYLSDAVEHYFRQGGRKVYVTRVVGPAATLATLTLGGGTGIRVDAASPGSWGAGLKVAVVAGVTSGTYVLVVTDGATGVELERSPELVDNAAAATWGAASAYVRVTALGSVDPAPAAAASLVGGTDDRASITDTHRTAALALFPRDLGPGQVSIVGSTTAAARTAVLTHARDYNRVAIMAAVDTPTVSTLVSDAAAIRTLGDLSKYGGLFAPWDRIPGLVAGTTRIVPPEARIAADCARLDGEGNPNVAAAGTNGRAVYAVGVTQEWKVDLDRSTLNDAGVNVTRIIYGEVRTYGFRTVADQAAYPLHWQLANVRTDMHIAAQADAIGETHVFHTIDGQGIEASAFGGKLTAMLAELHAAGALFGDTPDDAFRVDVGPSVNTPESISEGRLRAVLSVRRSPFAERVEVEVVRVAVSESL